MGVFSEEAWLGCSDVAKLRQVFVGVTGLVSLYIRLVDIREKLLSEIRCQLSHEPSSSSLSLTPSIVHVG